jgi:hypothetical protein
MNSRIVIAIRITRSRIGIAVFSNEKIEFARCLNLPYSNFDRAAKSLLAVASRTLDQFKDATLAIEGPEPGTSIDSLIAEVRELATERGVDLLIIPTKTLLETYSFPPLSSRSQIRKIAAQIWPGLALMNKAEILDAAALALHIQTERLFSPAEN